MSYEEEVRKYEEAIEKRLMALVKDEYKQYILDYLQKQDKPCSSTEITNNVFGKIMDIKSPDIGPVNIARASANMNILIREGKVQLLSNNDLILSEWGDRIEAWEKQIRNSFKESSGGGVLLDLLPTLQKYRNSESQAKVLGNFLDSLKPIIEKFNIYLDCSIEYFQKKLREE